MKDTIHITPETLNSDQKLLNRFLSSFEKTEGCWEWKGFFRKGGYGAFTINRRMYGAHRVSYEYFKGRIPKGKIICHKCDNPKCINPDHLFVGTRTDNYWDARKKGHIKSYNNILKPKKYELSDYKHPGSKPYDLGCRCEKCVAYKREIANRYRDRKRLKKQAESASQSLFQ